jgi:tetratricopeptide (TPR) repeat protein
LEVVTEPQRLEHNRLFQEANALATKEILLHNRKFTGPPGWWTRRKLHRALNLFQKVLELNPENWSAMWLSGKMCERLGDRTQSFAWLERAYQIHPSQPDVAREASMAAMNLGKHDAAISYAHRAVQIESANAGLRANLALAYLLAGSLPKAREAMDSSLAADPSDKISRTVEIMIHHFIESGVAPPPTTPLLTQYWQRHLKGRLPA